MTKEEFTALLDRYVQGNCLPGEEALFNRFVERMAEQPPDWSLADTERIRLEIYHSIRQQIQRRPAPAKMVRFPDWLRVAAAVAVVLTVAFYFITRERTPVLVTVVTKVGERDTVLLADGSRIYLNEASEVSFLERFAKDKRPVMLQGEAFFEVAKDKNRPFFVDAGGFRTVALGTSFNIRALNDSSDVKVSLVTGKVDVSPMLKGAPGPDVHTLIPGSQLRYKLAEKRVTIEDFNASLVLAWRAHQLSFENESLDAVLARLEKLYKIDIDFDKQVTSHCMVNGVFDENESVHTILSVLTFSNNLTFYQQHNKYIITGAGCE